MAHQLAGVDIAYANNVLLLKIVLYAFIGLLAAVGNVVVFANQAGNLYMAAFHFLIRYAIITDMRVGSHHYLPKVRWVGKYFLVAGHAGVKAYLACCGAYFPGSFSIKYSSVSQ